MEFVIKVKYGNTLRRFNSYIDEYSVMDINIDILRAKIISLFKLHPDAEFTLTYSDEDNDIVTLVDDDDLRDAVVAQRLNPLRINVLLNTSSDSGSQREASNPPLSPRVETPSSRLSASIEESLKSVPEPFRDALLNLSNDIISKATSSAPVVKELVESISNLGQCYLGPLTQAQGSATSGMLSTLVSGASTYPVTTTTVSPNVSSVQIPQNDLKNYDSHDISSVAGTKALPTSASVIATSVTQIPPIDLNNNDGGNIACGVGSHPLLIASSTNFTSDIPKAPLVSGCSHMDDSLTSACTASKENSESLRENEGSQSARAYFTRNPVSPLIAEGIQSLMHRPIDLMSPYQDLESLMLSPPQGVHLDCISDVAKNEQHPAGSSSQVGDDLTNSQVGGTNARYSAPQMGIKSTKSQIGGAGASGAWGHWHHHSRDPFQYEPFLLRTFHRGIRCDGCGMLPIMGPRYKSKVKENYDLCNICFSELGYDSDYTRIDRASYQTPQSFKKFCSPRRGPMHGVVRGSALKSLRTKLDSRFIVDVNVLDGTLLAPGTHFTKIWRMRNDGTVAWPSGTRLVWIGGDCFAGSGSVELEIPESGYPVGEELDIAVDFTAPSRPGRYTSFWRMALPSGRKFGQRVWVDIQVDNFWSDSFHDGFHVGFNLNQLPQESCRQKGKGMAVIDVNVEPMDGGSAEPDRTNVPMELSEQSAVEAELVKPSANGPTKTETKGHNLDQQIGGPSPLPDGSGAASQGISGEGASVSYPIIDFSEPSPIANVSEQSPAAAEVPFLLSMPSGVAGATEGDAYENTLLKELEEMGFKEVDLNKKILRKNEYDLEQSLDDLCCMSEWDPMLEELQDMGFDDRQLNQKLLIKNGGSIKRAVLDLIAGKKA